MRSPSQLRVQPADTAARTEVVGRVLNCRSSLPVPPGSASRPATGAPGCGTGNRYRSLAPEEEWDAAGDAGILAIARNEPSPPILLSVGANRLAVRVTAEDGRTQRTYTVSVERTPGTVAPGIRGLGPAFDALRNAQATWARTYTFSLLFAGLPHSLLADVEARRPSPPSPWTLPISADLCRSLPISADLCRSLPISANLCRCLPIFSNICESLPISADLCGPLRISADPYRWHRPPLSPFLLPFRSHRLALR